MEILKLFGIDWHLMLAQIINFAIVVGVLWWFALKPMVKLMKERNQEIARGVKNAERAEKRLGEVEKEAEELMREHRRQANKLLEVAQQQAEEKKRLILEKTKEEAAVVLEKTKVQIEEERKKMLSAAKQELAEVVARAVELILTEKVDVKLDKAYIQQILNKVKHEK